MIYVAVYLVLLLGAGMSGQAESTRRAAYFVLLAFMFVFVAFRYEVGCDWIGYLLIYQRIGMQSLATALEQREPLFMGANALLHEFQLDYPFINVITSVIYFAGFHRLARRQPDPLGMLILSFPLLILHLVMSGIRQATAIGVLCLAFNAFNDRKTVRYVALVVLAGGFHTSALIFLALTPFVIGELSRRNIALGAFVALPGLYFLASGEQFTVYYDRYVGTGLDALGAPFRTAFLTVSGAFFLFLLKDRWQRLCPVDYKLVWLAAMIMLALFPLSFFSSVIADRVAYYLMPLQIVILARVSYLGRGVFSPLTLAFPYVASGVMLVGWVSMSGHFAKCYVPYRFWLFA